MKCELPFFGFIVKVVGPRISWVNWLDLHELKKKIVTTNN